MPTEVRTRVLDADTLAGQFRVLCDLCVDLDPVGLDVSYGWACDLDQDDLYLDHRIETRGLSDFVRRATESGVFTLGESDLYIKGTSIEFCFTLCHESDIHIECQDASLIKRVTAVWAAAGVSFYAVE
jgi:hypothetical protein